MKNVDNSKNGLNPLKGALKWIWVVFRFLISDDFYRLL